MLRREVVKTLLVKRQGEGGDYAGRLLGAWDAGEGTLNLREVLMWDERMSVGLG